MPLTEWGMKFAKAIADCLKAPPPQISEYNGITTEEARDNSRAIIPLPPKEKDDILSCNHLKISQEQHERLCNERKDVINRMIETIDRGGDEDE